MAKTFRLPADEPLLNIASYGRGGPRRDIRLSPTEVDHIRRTVQRTPEVMVKVLSRASNDLKAAGKHIEYISRRGKLALETDDDTRLDGVSGRALMEEWDIDIDDLRRQSTLSIANGRKPPKLIHKLMFSMPPGTAPQKVLTAVRNLAREEFWGQHRYALVLHTDEAHPHVHLVLKAVSERGARLNIRRANLRQWRSEFARHLRLLGVAANATERAVRGESRNSSKDGIYRAGLRGESTYIRARAESVGLDLLGGRRPSDNGKSELVETRNKVIQGWKDVGDILVRQGHDELANNIFVFVRQMEPPLTDRERTRVKLLEAAQVRRHELSRPSR